MAKAAKKKSKKRAEHYEPKVKFGGTFEQMIGISITGAGHKSKKEADREEFEAILEDMRKEPTETILYRIEHGFVAGAGIKAAKIILTERGVEYPK